MAKFLVNQRIKIVNEFNTTNKLGMVGYVERIDPNDSTLTYRIRLDGRPTDWEWVREQDIEPETIVPVGKTLEQVKAEVAALDAQEAAAQTTLKSIAEHREKLRVELAGFGLGVLGTALVEAPKPITMGELYHRDEILRGDKFQWTGSNENGRDWNTQQVYTVRRVDSDESVLLTDERGRDDWAWENEGVFSLFVKAA